jgi:elongation factor Ts
MRKTGQAKAAKKAGRVAAEGIVIILKSADNKQAVILEVNSETDFVARDENFLNFSNKVAEIALAHKVNDIASLAVLPFGADEKETIEQARQHLVAKIGENINIRRVNTIETEGVLASYIHGNRIGVVVNLQGGDETLAKDIAMHIAANNPQVTNPEDVSADLIEKEKEIFAAQAQESGKPAEIIEKMIAGRIKKFVDEVSLLGQPFVKDPSINVGKHLASANAEVKSFVRFEVGEGIEKEVADFAKEVMEQARG